MTVALKTGIRLLNVGLMFSTSHWLQTSAVRLIAQMHKDNMHVNIRYVGLRYVLCMCMYSKV